MKRSFSIAAILLTGALAQAQNLIPNQGLPAAPSDNRNFGPDDPNQRKTSLPARPTISGFLAQPEGRILLPAANMPVRSLSEVAGQQRMLLPAPANTLTERSLAGTTPRSADLSSLQPGEKTNKLPLLPGTSEMLNTKATPRSEISPPAQVPPNRSQLLVPATPR
jgi:hypothetical protein